MYKFSIAVTKTYYKLHCLGRPKFIILCSYRSELGYSQGVSRVAVLSKGSGRESTSVPFPASGGHPHSSAHGSLSLPSKPAMLYPSDCSSIVTSPSNHSWEQFSACKNLYDQIGHISLVPVSWMFAKPPFATEGITFTDSWD